MRTYRLGDQISINLTLNEALETGMQIMATVRSEDDGEYKKFSTVDGTISKVSDTLYNLTISPETCLALGPGRYTIELALYTSNKEYVNIGTSTVQFDILNSTVGKEILK